MTFRERYMAGTAEFEEIFDLTDEWNFSDDPRTLREYLGLTPEEEDIWISESDEALEEWMEKEKKTKIFFTDLDGTLLNDQKEVPSENRKAIDRLLRNGHILVLTTGRALPSAKKLAERLGLTGRNCFIICYNGAQIYDTERQELLYRQPLALEHVRFVFDEASRFGIPVQTYSNTHVLAEKANPSLEHYAQIQDLPFRIVEDVTKELPEAPAKVLVLDYSSADNVRSFYEYFAPKCAGKMDLYFSDPALLELVPLGVNKGAAIRFLCHHLGLPMTSTVSAGDAENDLTMIQTAHIGAAMRNSIPLLKEAADYVTEADNNHGGVAEIIDKFIL